MASPAAAGSGLSKFIRPGGRLQSTDVQAAALWGVAAGTAALYLVQVPLFCPCVFGFTIRNWCLSLFD